MSSSEEANPYELDLDKNSANYAPLTPLGFIERTAYVYPDRTAVIHGARRHDVGPDLCALPATRLRAHAARDSHRRHGRAMLANTPEMLECHFGVPMAGAVLNTLNTRLDAEAIAFMLEHGGAKVLIADRELSYSAWTVRSPSPEYSGSPRRSRTVSS